MKVAHWGHPYRFHESSSTNGLKFDVSNRWNEAACMIASLHVLLKSEIKFGIKIKVAVIPFCLEQTAYLAIHLRTVTTHTDFRNIMLQDMPVHEMLPIY